MVLAEMLLEFQVCQSRNNVYSFPEKHNFKSHDVEGEKKYITTDDKVCVAGILSQDPILHDNIKDLIGETRGAQHCFCKKVISSSDVA